MKLAKWPVHVLVGVVVPAHLLMAATGGDGPDDPCPRKAQRSFDLGEVVVVKDGKPPCRLVFRETGLRLVAVSDGSRPDPGRTVLRDSKGLFYSANARGFGSVISVWDEKGGYLRSFGGGGEGPGEFSENGIVNLFLDGRDNLHVRDGGLSWSVFSPRQEFLRRVSAVLMGGSMGRTVILREGTALTSGRGDHDGANYFHLVDSAGTLRRSFGPVEDAVSRSGRSGRSLRRRIAYGGGDTFWAGPTSGGAHAYLLEEWGIDGRLRRAFRRDAPWYEWRGEERTSASVVQLHVFETDLLFVAVYLPSGAMAEAYAEARKQGRLRPTTEERLALAEVVLEVIDVRSGELLASERHKAAKVREEVPQAFFGGGRLGYTYKEEGAEGGLPSVEIVALELAAR